MTEFLNNNYAEIMLMAQKICKGSSEAEDVAHFAIIEFAEHERGEELVEAGQALSFISGIIWRSFHSSTSRYHTLYRQKGRMHSLPESAEIMQDDDAYDYDRDSATEAIQGILEDMKADSIELWFRATLFEMWIKEPNYSEIARQTGIPRTSISNAVEEAREYIKLTLKNNNITI